MLSFCARHISRSLDFEYNLSFMERLWALGFYLIDFSVIFDSEVLLFWLRCRGKTPFAWAKELGETKVMGILRPVPRHIGRGEAKKP